MKKTSVAILISAFLGVLVIIILVSLIFTVYDVSLDCRSVYGTSAEISACNADVMPLAEKAKFNNIFLLDKERLAREMEKDPRISVNLVECVFPNKAIVHYTMSTKDYQIKTASGYAQIGQNGKVIGRSEEDLTDPRSAGYNDGLVTVSADGLDEREYEIGDAVFEKGLPEYRIMEELLYNATTIVDDANNSVFDKSSVKSVEIASARSVTMRLRLGLTVKFSLTSTEYYHSAVQEFASWYQKVLGTSRAEGGTATVSFSRETDSIRIAYSL